MTLALAPPAVSAGRFADCCRLVGRELAYPDLAPATALDGSATATRDGRWLAGCAVPRRAAELMIRNERWPGRALCLVAPTHAQQIAAVLERLGPTRAVVAVVPSAEDLADVLACIDFSEPLAADRLHFAWDAGSLAAVFARHPGLAAPQQMARLPDANTEAATAVIAWAQPVLASTTAAHARRLADAARRPVGDGRCVLVGRHFRLWDDAGDTLARTIFQADVFDCDRPVNASEAAAAEAVAAAAVVIADRPRPAWAGDRTWVTWLTRPGVPAFDPAHAGDGLILTDAAWRPLARAAGWPDDRVTAAAPPAGPVLFTARAAAAFVLDLPDLAVPADFEDVTARRLVWEAIRDELTRDPFAVGPDAAKYVARAPARLGLPADPELPAERFVTSIAGPAFAVGVARWLAKQGVDFTLHGRGWQDETGLADRWRGPVSGREDFRSRVAAAGGLIDPSLPGTNPFVGTLGVPVVGVFARTPQRVLQESAALTAGRLGPAVAVRPALDAGVIDALVGQGNRNTGGTPVPPVRPLP